MRKSRYTFLIHENDDYLLYNSSKNSFWQIDTFSYRLLKDIEKLSETQLGSECEDLLTSFSELGILASEEQDDVVVDTIRMKHHIMSYSSNVLQLTLIPTLSCNLACPYCFEQNKRAGVMSRQVCQNIVDFIQSHELATKMSVTWFGGEPMLGVKVIETLLDKFAEMKNKKLVYHSMITNGILLNEENWGIFKKYPLDSVQITLDGIQETHDQRRVYKNGKGTYREIVHNIQSFIEAFPQTRIAIRVNVDKNNSHEFMTVYREMKSLFGSKENLQIYPGILKACGESNTGSPFLNAKGISEMMMAYFAQGYPMEYPYRSYGGCTATNLCGYVVGAKGEIYKCWMDVGKSEKIVGNIADKNYSNLHLLGKYMIHGSKTNDLKCLKCPLLPICSSDCPHDRLEANNINLNVDLCSRYAESDYEQLKRELYEFYKITIKSAESNL